MGEKSALSEIAEEDWPRVVAKFTVFTIAVADAKGPDCIGLIVSSSQNILSRLSSSHLPFQALLEHPPSLFSTNVQSDDDKGLIQGHGPQKSSSGVTI